MKSWFVALGMSLVISLCVGLALAAGPIPNLNAGHLAKGKFSSMQMMLEKTVLRVDVIKVDVRVGKAEQSSFSKIASGKKYSTELGKQLAGVAQKADNAVVQLTFQRSVSLNQWIDAVRKNLRQARDAGLISAAVEKKVSDGLPQWFSAMSSRGFKAGDRILYGVDPKQLCTAVVGKDGNLFVYRVDKDKEGRGVVMASYFAPGSEFREPLLQSLFD